MARVYMYNNHSDDRKVDKDVNYLIDFQCDIMSGNSVSSPTLLIQNDKVKDYLNCNYCYVDIFKRYYYITDFVMRANGMVEVRCNVDVLNTYKDYILSLQCLVARQEFNYNDLIQDSNVVQRVGTKTDRKRIGSIGNTISYVLTVTGGSGE